MRPHQAYTEEKNKLNFCQQHSDSVLPRLYLGNCFKWAAVFMTIGDRLKSWARQIKRDSVTLWFAGKNPATPWYAKALGIFVVAYALSPIDFIPDFIPVLGYVDDVLLLPGLIWLAIKLLPPEVLASSRRQADDWMVARGSKPSSKVGAVLIVVVWIGIGAALWIWLVQPWL